MLRENQEKGETWLKKFTSKMYYKVLQHLTRVEIRKIQVILDY